jgi:hypothetical protein
VEGLFSIPGRGKRYYVRFEVFTAMIIKNIIFWDMTPCGSCKDGRFGGKCHHHYQSGKNQRAMNNISNNYLRRALIPYMFMLVGATSVSVATRNRLMHSEAYVTL